MPKMKTHSGASKRFKKSADGKLLGRAPGRVHNLEHKDSRKKRKMRKSLVVEGALARKLGPVIK